MNTISPAPSTSSSASAPRFQLGSGLWQNIPLRDLGLAIDAETERARRVLLERELAVPELARLRLIAMAAAEAVVLFHQAALHEPKPSRLETYFAHFVAAAVQGTPNDALTI